MFSALPVRVWVIGDSTVRRAMQAADHSPWGQDLGLPQATIRYTGIGCLRLDGLCEIIQHEMDSVAPPVDIMIIHCGTCDIATKPASKDMPTTTTRDMLQMAKSAIDLARAYVGTEGRVMWSHILPRTVYHGVSCQRATEKKRQLLNRKLSAYVKDPNGIWHGQFTHNNHNKLMQCSPEFVHPTDRGLHILLSNWRVALSQVWEAHRPS